MVKIGVMEPASAAETTLTDEAREKRMYAMIKLVYLTGHESKQGFFVSVFF